MNNIAMTDGWFKTASPESQGISSKAVIRCLEKIKATGLFMHSFHIFRNGHLVAGGCADPIAPEMKRRAYSVMKSVTALAIYFCVQEGKLSLDDKVIDYFPEVKSADRNDPNLKKLTIRDILMMSAGHKLDAQREYDRKRFGSGSIPKTYRESNDPVGSDRSEDRTLKEMFFGLPFEAEPGKEFFYENAIPEIVGMLVEKTSGENYFDYLRPRLFEPLDIDICRCLRMPEYDGTERNFSATAVMTLRDMLKIGSFYLQRGCWGEKQLLKADIMDDGTRCHISTRDYAAAHINNGFSMDRDAFGYGYQLWMNKFGGYTLMGGTSQACICIPDKKLMISFACFDMREASSQDLDITRIIKDEIINDIKDRPLEEDPKAFALMSRLFDEWTTAPVLSAARKPEADGKVFAAKENDLGIKSVCLDQNKRTIRFEMTGGDERILSYGINGRFEKNSCGLGHSTDGYSMIFFTDPDEVYASGGWDGTDFILELHYTAHMNNDKCRLTFADGTVSIKG